MNREKEEEAYELLGPELPLPAPSMLKKRGGDTTKIKI